VQLPTKGKIRRDGGPENSDKGTHSREDNLSIRYQRKRGGGRPEKSLAKRDGERE